MTWWRLGSNSADYLWLILVEDTFKRRTALRKLRRGKPRPLHDTWQPHDVRFIRTEELVYEVEPTPKPTSHGANCLGFVGWEVWDKHAIDVLSPLVGDAVEFLPLNCSEGDFWLINVLSVVDCLDHDKAEITINKTGAKRIDQYVFKAGCLDNRHIFTMPEHFYARVIVSDTFKRLVEENELTGFIFTEEWS